ncbi:MAG: methyl-accepting chemotaxis protein [Deltaproteobacteria bacterium]|nr:methyl-accepting chemotaxis protein [Deltaproteobacteria bacterium]
MKFSDMKIGYKIISGYLAVCLMIVVAGITGYQGMNEEKKNSSVADASQQMILQVRTDMQMVMELLVSPSPQDLEKVWQEHLKAVEEFELYLAAIAKGAETDLGTVSASANPRLLEKITDADNFHNDKFLPAVQKIYEFKKKGFTTTEKSLDEIKQLETALGSMDEQADEYGNKMMEILLTSALIAKKDMDNAVKKAKRNIVIAIIVGVVFALLLGLLLSRKITAPLQNAVHLADVLSAGDLTATIALDQQDEVGLMVKALNKMVLSLQDVMNRIGQGVKNLSAASTQLSGASQGMASGAEELTAQASTTAAATEQISANLNMVNTTSETMARQSQNVAHSAEEISTNVNSIAAAVEEMSASIQEVSQNCAQAQQMAENASGASNDAKEKMTLLDQAARDIGKVIDVITEITEQTKLLALNATIEAARAGEAGKGFAVVASEVKELAKQTADATEKIASQIRDMQGRTTGVVNDIQKVTEINKKVHEYTYTIAAAVEEQTATAGEIARTIAGVAQRTSEVSNLSRGFSVAIEQELVSAIREASTGVAEVSRNIHGVNDVAKESARSASAINDSSNELAQLANELQAQVDKFKTR